MTGVWQDLRIGARMLIKQPRFTAVVVLALALGVGVTTVVFSLVNRFLLRPLAVPDPQSLVMLHTGAQADPSPRSQFAYPDYLALRQQTEVFAAVVAAHFDQYALGGEGASRQAVQMIEGEIVSGNYFDVIGVPARMGRAFGTAEGNDPAAAPIIVLGDGIWRRRFGADPGIIGKKVTLNGHPLTVIGVMPPGFTGLLSWQRGASYWYPLAQRPRIEPGNDSWVSDRSRHEVSLFARLRPGVSLAQAGARVEALGESISREFPATNGGVHWRVQSEVEGRFGGDFRFVRLGCLLGLLLACLVLVICCANVANLLLARASGRVKEVGIRQALGAGRARIVRQLMTESLLLALLGGGLGLVVASWLPRLLHALVPPVQFAAQLEVRPDPATVAWTLGVSLLGGLVFGSLPAWRASQGNLVAALKTDLGAEGQRLRRAGLRQALVVAQIAISVVVVLIGGLGARSVRNMQAIDPGFRPATLVTVQVNPGLFSDYGTASDPKQRAYFEELEQRLARLPGVRSVSSTSLQPLVNIGGLKGPVVRPGEAEPRPNEGLHTGYSLVHERYFETMETELLRGRDFQRAERVDPPATAIVNAELARRLYGSPAGAIGKRFRIGSARAPFLEIVGVARDGRYGSLMEAPQPWVFLPGCAPELDCEDLTFRGLLLRGQSARELPALVAGVRAEVARLDPRIPIEFVLTGEEHLDIHLYSARLMAGLAAMLAFLALALATLGVYSVMTYAVSQRTKEIGIRIALGGRVRDVVALVMRQGLGMALVGIAAGGILAALVGRLIDSFLFGVSGWDPVTFAGTVLVLAAVALLATLLPARRAARVSPMVAIRHDQGR